jgi:hypothetical protein
MAWHEVAHLDSLGVVGAKIQNSLICTVEFLQYLLMLMHCCIVDWLLIASLQVYKISASSCTLNLRRSLRFRSSPTFTLLLPSQRNNHRYIRSLLTWSSYSYSCPPSSYQRPAEPFDDVIGYQWITEYYAPAEQTLWQSQRIAVSKLKLTLHG